MSPARRVFLMMTVGCLLFPASLSAQDAPPPFVMATQYSSDLIVIKPDGTTSTLKTYVDGDKIRNEIKRNGQSFVLIVRKDLRKIYQLFPSQKMAMEMPYDPNLYKNAGAGSGPEGKFEEIGPEAVEGVTCTKFKVTSDKTKQVFYFWGDTAQSMPVQMMPLDNSFTVKWKNFASGAQPAALFEIPQGYQNMAMPKVPAMPPPPYRSNAPLAGTPPPTPGAPQNPGQPPATNSGSASQ